MGYIYKITNDINDKLYIGQTINSIEYRFKCHINEAKQTTQNKFHHAIYEIGPEHFTINLIEECNNEQLNERECYWINYYDSVNNGYNTTWGGSNGIHYNRQEILTLWETGLNIQAISDKLGIDRGLLGQILRCEGIESSEIKKRQYQASRIQTKNRQVYQIDTLTGKIIKKWDRISDVERELNISHTTIVKCCQLEPQAKTAGGYAWRYIEDYNEITDALQLISYTKRQPFNSKTVICYDNNNNILNEYISMNEAAKAHQLSVKIIKRCCLKNVPDKNNHYWRFK